MLGLLQKIGTIITIGKATGSLIKKSTGGYKESKVYKNPKDKRRVKKAFKALWDFAKRRPIIASIFALGFGGFAYLLYANGHPIEAIINIFVVGVDFLTSL